MTEKRLPQEDSPGHRVLETLSGRRRLRWTPPLGLPGGFRLPGSGSRGTRVGGATGRAPTRAAWDGPVRGGGSWTGTGLEGRGETAERWHPSRSGRRTSSAGAEGRAGRPCVWSSAPGCGG